MQATCTVMIYTDGTTSRYGVFRGRIHRGAFDVHLAQCVAHYELTNAAPDYRAMTRAHATAHFPAVPWQS